MKRKPTSDYVTVAPPWDMCPDCGHHELSHQFNGKAYTCIVFECDCAWKQKGRARVAR